MRLRVVDICKQKGLTLKDLADTLGITNVGLSQQINGNPTIDTLQKISKALNVEFWELFTTDTSKSELTALVEHKNTFYKAETLDGLKEIIEKIEGKK